MSIAANHSSEHLSMGSQVSTTHPSQAEINRQETQMSKLLTALVAGIGFWIDPAAAATIHFDLGNAKANEQIAQKPLGPNATTELQTRYGRFCVAPLPTSLHLDFPSNFTVVSRCATF